MRGFGAASGDLQGPGDPWPLLRRRLAAVGRHETLAAAQGAPRVERGAKASQVLHRQALAPRRHLTPLLDERYAISLQKEMANRL